MNIAIFGAPGSGKGTQSAKLIDEYGLYHISTGELLRDHIKRGTELGRCKIARNSKNDRKNYFYPDLPKAYQISQFDMPLCYDGYINIETEEGEKKIRLERIHIEEDTGKLNHDDYGRGSLLDLNRAGVPLIECVSKPDLRTKEEVDSYLKKIKSIFEYIEISDCKIQEGSLRADVNISVRKKGTEELGTRTETKGMNSFQIGRAHV